MTRAQATVVFCDLDGTLVLDNSFHRFLGAMWSLGRGRQRLGLALAVLPRLAGRLWGGHDGMKRRVLLFHARQDDAFRAAIEARLVARLAPLRSAPVARALASLRDEGARIVLATAAPEAYAPRLARWAGAEACLATPTPGAPGTLWLPMSGARKAEACRDFLAREAGLLAAGGGLRIVAISDDAADLPLLAMADQALIQAPTPRLATLSLALSGGPEITTIDTWAEEPDGGLWLWFDDAPVGPLDDYELRMTLSKHRHALIYAGKGRWRRIAPGAPEGPIARRRDCPAPPSGRQRLAVRLRRRVQRDWLGIFH